MSDQDRAKWFGMRAEELGYIEPSMITLYKLNYSKDHQPYGPGLETIPVKKHEQGRRQEKRNKYLH